MTNFNTKYPLWVAPNSFLQQFGVTPFFIVKTFLETLSFVISAKSDTIYPPGITNHHF